MDKVIEQLKELRLIAPREDWVKQNKELLVSQIKAQTPAKQSSVFSYWYLIKLLVPMRLLNFMAKPLGVVTLAGLLIVASGAYSVNASKGSLPGDVLYPVKLTTEKVKVGLTTSQPEKTELRISHAEERVNEIEKIIQVESDLQKRQDKVKVAATNLKEEMATVTNELEKVKTDVTEKSETQKTIEVIQKVDVKTQEITVRLEQNKLELNKNASDGEASRTLDEAVTAVKETGVKATEVIVDKFDKGEVELAPQDVKDSVENKIKEAEATLTVVTEQAKSAGEVIKKADEAGSTTIEVKPAEVEETKPAVSTEAPASTSYEATSTEPTVSTEVAMPVAIEATPENAKKLLAEAQELMNQGNLKLAMEKLQLVSSMTQQVKSTVEAQLEELEAKLPAEDPATTPTTETMPTTEVSVNPAATTTVTPTTTVK